MSNPSKTYTNPRLNAVIEDWPSGSKRVTANFTIETDPKRGERAVRTTTGKPTKLTYADKARIVDGDDGRTYIANLTGYGHVSIMRGDMKYQEESIFESDPRYADVRSLFESSSPNDDLRKACARTPEEQTEQLRRIIFE